MKDDSLNWFFYLLIAATGVIGLSIIVDGMPALVQGFGYALTLGSFIFLIDLDGTPKFRNLSRSILGMAILIILAFGSVLFLRETIEINTFRAILYLVHGLTLLSVVVLSFAMHEFSTVINSDRTVVFWKRVKRFSLYFFLIPLIVFLGAFILSLFGFTVEIFTGVTEPGNKVSIAVLYLVRVLFLVPPMLVILGTSKTIKALHRVAP